MLKKASLRRSMSVNDLPHMKMPVHGKSVKPKYQGSPSCNSTAALKPSSTRSGNNNSIKAVPGTSKQAVNPQNRAFKFTAIIEDKSVNPIYQGSPSCNSKSALKSSSTRSGSNNSVKAVPGTSKQAGNPKNKVFKPTTNFKRKSIKPKHNGKYSTCNSKSVLKPSSTRSASNNSVPGTANQAAKMKVPKWDFTTKLTRANSEIKKLQNKIAKMEKLKIEQQVEIEAEEERCVQLKSTLRSVTLALEVKQTKFYHANEELSSMKEKVFGKQKDHKTLLERIDKIALKTCNVENESNEAIQKINGMKHSEKKFEKLSQKMVLSINEMNKNVSLAIEEKKTLESKMNSLELELKKMENLITNYEIGIYKNSFKC